MKTEIVVCQVVYRVLLLQLGKFIAETVEMAKYRVTPRHCTSYYILATDRKVERTSNFSSEI